MVCLAAIIGGAIFAINSFSKGETPTASAIHTPPAKENPESTDSTAPIIIGAFAGSVDETSAVIAWTTNEAATSQVIYGLTASYGSTSAPDMNLVTRHTITLSGLTPGTKYYFKVKSKDASGNETVDTDRIFTTSAASTTTPPVISAADISAPSIASTVVGGIIPASTVWTAQDSPYLITSTIQVPAGVTLTIEPGVSASMSGSDDHMFIVYGKVLAHGMPGNRISFDGGMRPFFSCENAGPDSSVDLNYCEIKNGASIIDFAKCFYLRHSEITNLTKYSDISFGPTKDVYIEYNKFTNASGFSTGGGANVYIRYNYFNSRNLSIHDIPWIMNRASPATMVQNNFFSIRTGLP